jgi:hypothetical protein
MRFCVSLCPFSFFLTNMELEIVVPGFEYRLKVQYHSMTCPLRLVTRYHSKLYNTMHWAHSLIFLYWDKKGV